MTKVTKIIGLYGISSLIVRFSWIQIFRFRVVRTIKSTPAGWDINGIWVGGPLGWQHLLLEFFLYSGLIALLAASCLLCRDFYSHTRSRVL